MKQEVKIGQTDYTALVVIRDTAGAPKTGLAYDSGGLDVCYVRVETDNDVVLGDGLPATQTLTGAHSDWGFVEVDGTKAPGLYRLDLADEVFATGAWSAVVSIIGTGLTPTHLEFVLVPEAPYTGVNVSTITANAVNATAIAAGAIDAATFAADVDAEVAGYVWDALRSAHTTVGSFGDIDTTADIAATVWDTATSGHTTSGTFGEQAKTDIDAILADTGTDGVALTAGAVDAVLDEAIGDGTITMRQALRVCLAALAGKLTGAGTTTVTIRNVADSANVVVATVDADGNRSPAPTVTP